ncbi:MAG: UDP-N-acetylglucosamine 2-epimerase (hydrolyzing) [Lachnospiraceae bacterium]|nr:UDP-N-acetylglucosamine 2-epimerase (hydrolyzing) [Lachnospiraceae bacterium]
MKKILFITGTRADYGKIKPLIRAIEDSDKFEAYIYVSGMHVIPMFGNTYKEVLKDQYKNIYVDFGLVHSNSMSLNLGNVICRLSGYVQHVNPDMIVVHGDRIDAMAGAVVGALNNIKVAHIEGGEISGTIDESIRHAISKFAHIHFVCNEEAKKRLIQMGESKEHIYIIGSPDIDIMLSDKLPTLEMAKEKYEIPFDEYGILMYHPVTTEYNKVPDNIKHVVDAVLKSNENYVVIYPNNDQGSEFILNEYKRLKDNDKICIYPSVRFEYFLTLLKNAKFVLGNSSAGVRETGVYGIPAIDVGNRQTGRYSINMIKNIQHVMENEEAICNAIKNIGNYKTKGSFYGDGNSVNKFMEILNRSELWELELQKKFIEKE